MSENTSGTGGDDNSVRRHPSRNYQSATGSGILLWFKQGAMHDQVGADAAETFAQLKYRSIVKSSNWPGGVDKRLFARKMRRLILRIAAVRHESAVANRAARQFYIAKMGHPSQTKRDRKRGHDPNK